jgi:hypothetical protein
MKIKTAIHQLFRCALILQALFILIVGTAQAESGCSHVECMYGMDTKGCDCGFPGYCDNEWGLFTNYRTCVPVGRFKICVNRPSQVGSTGKCVTVYNWRNIVSCPVSIWLTTATCTPVAWAACVLDLSRVACIPCSAALTGVARTCGGCDITISCSAAEKEPKYAQVYDHSQAAEGCSGGLYTCDPEFFPNGKSKLFPNF